MPRRKKSEKMFRDAWNPTREEVLRWAYTPNVYAPDQDFELAVYDAEFHDLILQCADDQACPQQYFFLSCLYVLVGDAVRTNWKVFSQVTITNFIEKGQQAHDSDVQNWAERAKKLIVEPALYNYDQWGLSSSFVYEARQQNKKKKNKRIN